MTNILSPSPFISCRLCGEVLWNTTYAKVDVNTELMPVYQQHRQICNEGSRPEKAAELKKSDRKDMNDLCREYGMELMFPEDETS